MFVHMWEPWEWVSGVDVFSPPESSSKLALAHRASGTEVYTTQTSERYHRGMSMRNVEFPELEHAKAQAEEERERVCRFKNRSAWPTLRGLCGFTVSCSHQLAWRSTMTAARVLQRRAGHAGRWWCARWGRVEQLTSRQCLGARSTARGRTARPSGRVIRGGRDGTRNARRGVGGG